MKIDCPHCGVHGSVDNSLLDRKLRCPKCSKVFLVTEDLLPEFDNTGMLSQEILYDDEPLSPDLPVGDDDLLAAMGEESPDDEGGEVSAEEDDDLLGLMDDEDEDEDLEVTLDDDREDDFEDDLEPEGDSTELEKCSGCGELLDPAFLETVGSLRYCALCAPEEDVETDDETGLTLTEVDGENEVESIGIEGDSTVQALMDDEITDGADVADDEGVGESEVSEDAEEDEDNEGYPKEPCSVCGEEFHRDFMQEIDSKLFCGVCQPEVIEEESKSDDAVLAGVGAVAAAGAVMATGDESDAETPESGTDFTIGELIKEAWQKTKGVKAPIWGAVIAMCLTIFVVSFGGIAAIQGFYKGSDPTITMGANSVVQLIANWLSMLMTGGIMLIGVRHALEQRVSWKMVFAGFSKALSITIALILQTILILIGFVLLVIPGIYLSVGYALVLPLILDKGMGPWEALEASRKAIHKKWWTVFGLYLVMMLLYTVSAIPLGLGMIWTVPMFFVLIGVLYVRLFGGSGEIVEEDLVDDLEDESDESDAEVAEEIEEVEEKLEEISEEIEPKNN